MNIKLFLIIAIGLVLLPVQQSSCSEKSFIETNQGNIVSSDNSNEVANNLSDTIKSSEYLNNAILLVGKMHFEKRNYDSALKCFEYLKNLNIEAENVLDKSKLYNYLGDAYFAKNNLSAALEYFNKAITLSKEQYNYYNLGSAYSNLGLSYLNKHDLQKADKYLDSSILIAKSFDYPDILLNAYYQKSKLYQKEGKDTESQRYSNFYSELRDSILAQDTNSAPGILLYHEQQENKLLLLEKKQDRRKTVYIILFSLFIIVLISAASAIYITQLRQKNKLENELASLQKHQFNAVLEAQESERKRIASDLHDSVGQMLSVTKLNMSDLLDSISEIDKVHQHDVRKTIEIIDEACQEIREISHNLMPGSLMRLGFVAATRDLIRKLNHKDKLHIDFRTVHIEERLDEKIEVALYRILQEILNNAMKHSDASKIYIILSKSSNQIELSIRDNGKGFNTDIIKKSKGIGWKNIYSRLSVINGDMSVKSKEGQGVHIKIEVPV